MKIKSLERILCVAMLSIVAAQPLSRAQEPADAGTTAQTVFAYRSSFWARVNASLFWESDLPSDVPVELAPVDPSALAHATVNSTITFRIVRDVIAGHETFASAGTLIEARVVRIRDGKLRAHHGRTEPRVMEVAVAGLTESGPPPDQGALKLTLEATPRNRFGRTAKQLATVPLKVIHWTVVIPVVIPVEWVLLAIFCSTGCDL